MISTARKSLPAALAFAVVALAGAPRADAAWNLLNMNEGVTELSKQIYSLHMTIFWWCVAIGVAVFGVMIYALLNFRKSKGAIPDTSITHSTKVEIIWTVIPVLILVVMAIPATRALINIEDMRNTEMTVKVTGYQWRWQYEYLDEGISFFSVLDRKHDEIRQLDSGLDPASVPDDSTPHAETVVKKQASRPNAYATVFAQVYASLTADQTARLSALRKSIMSGTYADGTAFDFSSSTTSYLYSEPIQDTSVWATMRKGYNIFYEVQDYLRSPRV